MKRILLLLLVFLLVVPLVGQTVKELENQRKNTLKQLETTTKVLDETRKSRRASVNKLNIINQRIQERTRLIRNIDREIQTLDREVQRLRRETQQLERKLVELKAEYAQMIQEAHINRSIYARIMFVLSAESFDQTFRRLRYLQEFASFRKLQVEQIEKTKADIEQKTNTLAQHRQTQVDIREQQQSEATKLSTDRRNETRVLNDLQTRERTLRTQLQQQQRIANNLNRRIEQLIAEEIRKADERQRASDRTTGRDATGRTTPRPSTDRATERLTREQTLISGNFQANAGRLPWPVERGFISGRFGVHPHPVLKHITTNNRGVYIQTPARSNARAVFEGVVTQRFSVPGSNNGVIIQHGQYRTVYANLTDIFVRVGQKVEAKQNIGRIFTDVENENKTELFFQVWQDRTILNPERWITR